MASLTGRTAGPHGSLIFGDYRSGFVRRDAASEHRIALFGPTAMRQSQLNLE
jgi:hypothetical protein